MADRGMTDDVRIMLGDYRRALAAMTVPILISLLIAQANTFIDTVWCSLLGSTALAAIGIVSSYYMLMVGIGSGVGIGVSAVMSAHIAAGDKSGSDRSATQTLVFMVLVGLICTPVFFLVGDSILLAVSDDAYAESVMYAHPFYISALPLVIQGVMIGILRGEGAARRSMVITVSTAILNMVFDPLFAFTLGLGVSGLAWATIVATILSLIPFFHWFFFRTGRTYTELKRSDIGFDRRVLKEVLSIGVPKALELDIMWVLNFISCYFVMLCGGSSGVAIYTTGWKYVDLIQTPSNALAAALVPIASAAYGVRDYGKMRSSYLFTIVCSLVVTTILAVLLFVSADYAVMVFSGNESSSALQAPMAEAIRIYVIVAVLFAVLTISSSFLQAIRRADCSMWSTLIRNIVLITGFAITCSYSLVTMWWAFVATEVFGLVLMTGWAEYEYRKIRPDC